MPPFSFIPTLDFRYIYGEIQESRCIINLVILATRVLVRTVIPHPPYHSLRPTGLHQQSLKGGKSKWPALVPTANRHIWDVTMRDLVGAVFHWEKGILASMSSQRKEEGLRVEDLTLQLHRCHPRPVPQSQKSTFILSLLSPRPDPIPIGR